MKPAAFDYLRPDSIEEALQALADGGEDARLIAGGQSLVAMLNFRLVEPSILIDISRLADLNYIREADGMIEVGAAATQVTLQRHEGLADKQPLLAKAIPYLGHFQTRNRGTVCGSLAHADPSSELPLCLATLGGEVVLRSVRGERTLKASDFQTGMLSTAKADDEIVAAARFPLAKPGAGHAFHEKAERRGDFAIVALAAISDGDALRLGIGGVADRPTVRDWEGLPESDWDEALNAFAWDLGGYDDIHANARYRRELVRRLGKRVLREAVSCRS